MEPQMGHMAWTLTGGRAEGTSVARAPVPVRGGFVVGITYPGSSGCVTFISDAGEPRWAIQSNAGYAGAAQVGDLIVIAHSVGKMSVFAVDAATGKGRWSLPGNRGIWLRVATDGKNVLVTGFGGGILLLDGASGRIVQERFGGSRSPSFRHAIVDDGFILTSGTVNEHGEVLAFDSAGRVALEASVDLFSPDPVAVVGDTIVLQSSGTTSDDGKGEPTTHLVGIDRRTGAARWRRVLDGERADLGVEAGGLIVARHTGALTGVDARTGAIIWTKALAPSHFPQLAPLDDGSVAVGEENGLLLAVEAVDGRVRWQTGMGAPIAVLGSLGPGRLLAVAEPDQYVAFTANDGTKVWAERGPVTGRGFTSEDYGREVQASGDLVATRTGLYGAVGIRRGS